MIDPTNLFKEIEFLNEKIKILSQEKQELINILDLTFYKNFWNISPNTNEISSFHLAQEEIELLNQIIKKYNLSGYKRKEGKQS